VPPEPPQERVEFRFGGRVTLDGVSVQARRPPAGPEIVGERPTDPVNELPPMTMIVDVPWLPASAVTDVTSATTVKSVAAKTERGKATIFEPAPCPVVAGDTAITLRAVRV
jgi:hypothetical protein